MSGARRDQLAKSWAKKLGVTIESLRGAKKDSASQMVSTEIGADPEPWPDEVEIAEVLEELHTVIKTYIATEDYNVTIVVFWIVFTWVWEHAHYLPLLVLTSPERECGKITLRDLIIALSRRSMRVASIPDGSVHRLVGLFRPTLCVDEAEKLAQDRPNTVVVLNSGFEHGEKIPRFNTETGTFEYFDPACPKLVSGIGTYLEDHTLSRSFIIEMRRATVEEENGLVDGAFFNPGAPRIVELRRKMLRWANDHGAEYRQLSRDIMLEMPRSIRGRNKNKFASLFGIAKQSGDDWVDLITKAAFLLLQETTSHANISLEHQLLGDCYKVVTTRPDLLIRGAFDRLFIGTPDLIQALHGLPETPSYSMPKSGKPLTANQLFYYLKRYKIKRKVDPSGTRRGIYVDRILEEYSRCNTTEAANSEVSPDKPDADEEPPEPPPSSPPPSPPSSSSPSDTGESETSEVEDGQVFPRHPSQKQPSVSEGPFKSLNLKDLPSDTEFSAGVRSDIDGVRFNTGDPKSETGAVTSDTDAKIRCQTLSISALTRYPMLLTPDTEKRDGVRGYSISEPFSGLLGDWDRFSDGLEIPNKRFSDLLISPSQWFALDIETFAPPVWGKNKKKPLKTNHALNPWIGSIRLVTFADAEHIYQCDLFKAPLGPELISHLSSAGWISHNAKFETLYLGLHFGLAPKAVFCTRIANAILTNGLLHNTEELLPVQKPEKQSRKKKKASLNSLWKALTDRLGVVLPKDQGDSDWCTEKLSTEQQEYSLNDVRYLDRLASKQLTTIRADGLETVCMLETLLLPVVVKMERHGFAVDREKLECRRKAFEQEAETKRKQAEELLGEGCPKLGDSRKKGGLLDFIEKRLGRRLRNLKEETLAEWDHSVGRVIVEYKHAQKRLATFESLLKHSALDGRIHPTFNQMGAVTGRFSCTEPNAQQMEKGPNLFRDCYIASGLDRVLVCSDFKHIEMRTAAIFANAVTGLTTLLDVFKAGLDIHTMTAADVLHRAVEEITKNDRQLAKAVGFGFVYGQQALGFLAYAKNNYGILLALPEAEQFRRDYFLRYPDLAGWHQWAWDEVDNATESRTILGRRHLIPPNASKWNKFRALVNTPACGSAADLIKWSMIELDRLLPSDTHLVMCVHDELVCDAPAHRAQEIKELMEQVMTETFAKLFDDIIPGPAEASFGSNWEAAKP
jgi:DNA polymerase I-like protein with 3'-5' exonuclease and polymerase domains